jgi:ABC transporter, substrate-binding protein, family 3
MKKFMLFVVFCGAIFANTLDEIKEKGVLRIGVYRDNPPFAIYENGKIDGFEIELSNKIAQEIFKENPIVKNDINATNAQKGTKDEPLPPVVDFVIIDGAKNRIPALQDNKVDAIVTIMTITKDRQEQIDFSQPYLSVNIGILSRKSDKIRNLNDLKEKILIVKTDTSAQKYFEKEGIKTIECKTNDECYKALKSGAGDAWAADNLVVLSYATTDETMEVNIQNLGRTDFLAIGVSKGNKELLEAINNALFNLNKSGFFENAYKTKFEPFYKGKAEKKYFLLDGIYNSLFL